MRRPVLLLSALTAVALAAPQNEATGITTRTNSEEPKKDDGASQSGAVSSAPGEMSAGDDDTSSEATDDTSQRKIARVIFTDSDGKVAGEGAVDWVADEGTHFQIELVKGTTKAEEQYKWHVHNKPVTGDCSSTGGHLDPTGSAAECDSTQPWMCQEGDISGKHGPLNGTEEGKVSLSVTDAYVRWEPAAFSVLGRSIVIHNADGDPWICGNITSILDDTATENNQPSGKASTYQTYPEASWPDPPADNVGWTPSIQEAPEVSISVDETGKRTVTVGRISEDASASGSASMNLSGMSDMLTSKDSEITASGVIASGAIINTSGVSASGSQSASNSASTDAGDNGDSGASALTAGVGLGLMLLTCLLMF